MESRPVRKGRHKHHCCVKNIFDCTRYKNNLGNFAEFDTLISGTAPKRLSCVSLQRPQTQLSTCSFPPRKFWLKLDLLQKKNPLWFCFSFRWCVEFCFVPLGWAPKNIWSQVRSLQGCPCSERHVTFNACGRDDGDTSVCRSHQQLQCQNFGSISWGMLGFHRLFFEETQKPPFLLRNYETRNSWLHVTETRTCQQNGSWNVLVIRMEPGNSEMRMNKRQQFSGCKPQKRMVSFHIFPQKHEWVVFDMWLSPWPVLFERPNLGLAAKQACCNLLDKQGETFVIRELYWKEVGVVLYVKFILGWCHEPSTGALHVKEALWATSWMSFWVTRIETITLQTTPTITSPRRRCKYRYCHSFPWQKLFRWSCSRLQFLFPGVCESHVRWRGERLYLGIRDTLCLWVACAAMT